MEVQTLGSDADGRGATAEARWVLKGPAVTSPRCRNVLRLACRRGL